MSSLEATPASHFRSRVSAAVKTILGTCGPMWPESCERSGPDLFSSRTWATTFDSDSARSEESFSRWATALRRDCLQRRKWALRTKGNGSSFWASPQAHDVHPGNPARVGRYGTKHGGRNLTDDASAWPTPRSSPNENRTTRNAPSHGKTHGKTLAGEAASFPTPSAQTYGNNRGGSAGRVGPVRHSLDSAATKGLLPSRQAQDTSGNGTNSSADGQSSNRQWMSPRSMDARGGDYTRDSGVRGRERPSLTREAKGMAWPSPRAGKTDKPESHHKNATGKGRKLNPLFVEWLMGWPIGWTGSAPVEMELSLFRRQWRSYLSGRG